jgi:hypothetical protein
MAHFRKQLITPSASAKHLSVIDHIDALSPSDLMALEASVHCMRRLPLCVHVSYSAIHLPALQAVCSRLSKNFLNFPHPCRVLGLNVDRTFMAGLVTVVSSLIGSFLRVLASQ